MLLLRCARAIATSRAMRRGCSCGEHAPAHGRAYLTPRTIAVTMQIRHATARRCRRRRTAADAAGSVLKRVSTPRSRPLVTQQPAGRALRRAQPSSCERQRAPCPCRVRAPTASAATIAAWHAPVRIRRSDDDRVHRRFEAANGPEAIVPLRGGVRPERAPTRAVHMDARARRGWCGPWPPGRASTARAAPPRDRGWRRRDRAGTRNPTRRRSA